MSGPGPIGSTHWVGYENIAHHYHHKTHLIIIFLLLTTTHYHLSSFDYHLSLLSTRGNHGLDHGLTSQAFYIKLYIMHWFESNPKFFLRKFDLTNFHSLWPNEQPSLNDFNFFKI